MAYQIYRREKVESIYTKKVTPVRTTKEVADPVYKREEYEVEVVLLASSRIHATFHEFKNLINVGDFISVAINDKKDIIAIINHTKKKEGRINSFNMKWDDIGGLAFFLAFPILIGGFLFRSAYLSSGFSGKTIGIAVVTLLILYLIFRAVNNHGQESIKAFRELKQNASK